MRGVLRALFVVVECVLLLLLVDCCLSVVAWRFLKKMFVCCWLIGARCLLLVACCLLLLCCCWLGAVCRLSCFFGLI